jgi:hypothetical protein
MNMLLTKSNQATWWYHHNDPDGKHKLYEQNTDGGTILGPASLAGKGKI